MSEANTRRPRRAVTGVVTSDKMDKTITVRIDRMVQHPKFKKYIKRSSVFKAHDEKNAAHVGDRVSIQECRPISKHKSFRLIEVIERSRLAAATQAEAPAPGQMEG